MKQSPSRMWLVVTVVATLLFVGVWASPSFSYRSITLEQLITAIEEGQVRQVIVRNDTQVLAQFNDGTAVRTTKPAEMELLENVEITNSDMAVLYSEQTNPLGQVIRAGMLLILPLIIITTLYMFYISRVNAAKMATKG